MHQPEKPELPRGRRARRRLRVRALHPAAPARAVALAERPSVAAAALARRRAGRARDPRRRRADRRDDPRDRRGARRRADRRAARRSRSASSTRARCSRARPRSLRGCSTRCSSPDVRAAARGGRDLRGEDHARRPRARTSTIRVDAWRRVRALSPHIGAWATLQGRRVTIWRARLEDGRVRARRSCSRRVAAG